MLDPAGLTAIILSALALVGAAWGQVRHCESGCVRCDKEAAPIDSSELLAKKPA